LIVNTVGSFIIGFFMPVFLGKLSLDPLWRLFIAVGFCGGFTTMSSLTYETFAIMMDGDYIKAGLNVLLNMVFSFGSAFLGIVLAKILL
ncbi:CrcB family protein, partial [Sulfurihydrogenibium sp.]|uniref:CrcB family protein n=1 Tax=Sulfurihydrogenibium sp. TaxID=2053621 RepID=UPI00260EA575